MEDMLKALQGLIQIDKEDNHFRSRCLDPRSLFLIYLSSFQVVKSERLKQLGQLVGKCPPFLLK